MVNSNSSSTIPPPGGYSIVDLVTTKKYIDLFKKNKYETLCDLKSAHLSRKDLSDIGITALSDVTKISNFLSALEKLHHTNNRCESFLDKYFPVNAVWKKDIFERCTLHSGEIYQFVQDHFPKNFKLQTVEMVRNTELMQSFVTKVNALENRRTDNVLFNKPLPDDGEKEAIRQKLLQLFIKDESRKLANIMLMWHGCSEKSCFEICKGGIADLRRTDGGFFGSGIYLTSYCEYALRYSTGTFNGGQNPNGEYVVLLCLATVGLTYVISRKTDYPNNSSLSKFHYKYPNGERNDKALEAGFDSHYVCVSRQNGYQAVRAEDADYDELVLKEEAQVLPLAIVYFKK